MFSLKKLKADMNNLYEDLEKPLMSFKTDTGVKKFTLKHAFESLLITGGLGSGKTTSSGKHLALAYLRNSFGGLVLTAKPSERKLWEKYCEIAGRTNDLIIISPGSKYHFNFLEYQNQKGKSASDSTDNIVQLLKSVIEAGEDKDSGNSADPFWKQSLELLIFSVIDLCKLAYSKISVQLLSDIVHSIPKKSDSENNNSSAYKKEKFNQDAYTTAFNIARNKVLNKVAEFKRSLTTDALMALEKSEFKNEILMEEIPEYRLIHQLDQFFNETFLNLSGKTRSIVEFIVSSFLLRLLREPIYSILCRYESNFTPEDSIHGKIILLDLPVKKYHKAGKDAQLLFKFIWQRAMEDRDFVVSTRPLFLWADECQEFLIENDTSFNSTCRSSRISNVMITQNLANLYANMGGSKAEYRVKSLLGTFGTKIFHANADVETNKYASELIGDTLYVDKSNSVSMGENFSFSNSESYKLQRIFRPEQFASLKTGGYSNDFIAQAVIHNQSGLFNDTNRMTVASFKQIKS